MNKQKKNKLVIFGTGQVYQKMRPQIREDIEITALIDNDASKWGMETNGVEIIQPQKIMKLEYDYILLASAKYMDMELQLKEMGVQENSIIIPKRAGILYKYVIPKYYGTFNQNHDNKNVLVISHALTPSGAQNVMFYALAVLKRNGYNIIVMSDRDGILRDKLLKMDIPVVLFEDYYSQTKDFESLAEWAETILVNTVWLYDLVIDLEKFHRRLIWWIHETGGIQCVKQEIFRKICNIEKISVCAVSPLVRRKILEYCGNDCHISELKYGLPERKGNLQRNPQQKMIFAIIGAIAELKGQDIFIRAVNNLPEECKREAEFWIVGAGNLDEKSTLYVQSNSCIEIKGEIDNECIPDLYQQIDVVVCCSREDALPVAVAEGFLNKKPAIVSDVTGIAEYMKNGKNGFIFESENAEQLCSLFQWTITHKAQMRQMGNDAEDIYREYFTMEVFEKNILNILQIK